MWDVDPGACPPWQNHIVPISVHFQLATSDWYCLHVEIMTGKNKVIFIPMKNIVSFQLMAACEGDRQQMPTKKALVAEASLLM